MTTCNYIKRLFQFVGCAVLFASSAAHAQPAGIAPREWGRVGPKLGPSTVGISNPRGLELSKSTRFEAGVLVRVALFPWLDYQPEVIYSSRSYSLISDDNTEFSEFYYHYVGINWLHARFHLPYRWEVNPYLSVGLGKTSYLLTALSEDERGHKTERRSPSNDIDVGSVNVSLGVEFALANGGTLGVEFRFDEGWRHFIDEAFGRWHNGIAFLFSYHLPLARVPTP